MLAAPREPDRCACDRLQALLQKRAVIEHEQPLRDLNPAVGIDANQMIIKGRVMDLREGDAVGEHRLPEKLMASAMMCAASSR
jgi:hypothetical protein